MSIQLTFMLHYCLKLFFVTHWEVVLVVEISRKFEWKIEAKMRNKKNEENNNKKRDKLFEHNKIYR